MDVRLVIERSLLKREYLRKAGRGRSGEDQAVANFYSEQILNRRLTFLVACGHCSVETMACTKCSRCL